MKSFILLTLLIISSSLFAQNAENKNRPCADDLKKFCASVEKGEGRIAKCLKEHEKEISPACATKLADGKEKMRARAKDIYTNCKDDLDKLCKEVVKGHGGKMKCLESKKDQISEKCKAVLP